MKAWYEEKVFYGFMLGLYVLMRVTAFRSARFRDKLYEKDLALVMKARKGTPARTFRCFNGRVRSHGGQDGDVVSHIVWISPRVGSRIMFTMVKGDPKALMRAVMKGELVPEGDAAGIKWFLDVVGLLNAVYHTKRKTKAVAES